MKPLSRKSRSLRRDRTGGVTILLAGSLLMLAGSATVAVDLGSLYLAKRQLQGIADAAALAAVSGGRPAAEQLIAHSGVDGVVIASVEDGQYRADPAVPVPQRFVPDDPAGGALRLEVRRRAPLFFGRMLVGKDGVDLSARATAARKDAAAFSIGTGLASVSDGLPNMLLSALAGTSLNLSVMDTQGLLDARVDLLHMADALQARLGRQDEAFVQLFDRHIPLADVVNAIADGVTDSQTVGALRRIGNSIPGRTVRLKDIIDLGPAGSATDATGQPTVLMDAFSMLRMVLNPGPGVSVPIDLQLGVPGLSSTRLKLILGGGSATSPLLTITSSRDVVLRTAQTRIYLESAVAAALAPIASIRVPLYIELAEAEARLSDINCARGTSGHGVTLLVKPSIGSAALADVDQAALTDFSRPANPRPAVLADVLTTKVTARANIALGGVQPQTVHFSPAQISAQQSQTVSTQDLTQGLAASLVRQVQIDVYLLGLKVGLSPLTAPIGALLGTTAPLLDGVLNNVTALLGVRLGTAEVRVHEMRCGLATIVA
ncbi:MAG: pilus assembly protein TadG-related protein [Sphingobium sp.]